MRNDHEISIPIISIHWIGLTMRKFDKILHIYSIPNTQNQNEKLSIQLNPNNFSISLFYTIGPSVCTNAPFAAS